jgi:clavulanate-9-aldehyde reductase
MDHPLEGRRVLVTGGSSGIGEAMLDAFVDAGASVGVLGRDPDRLRSIAQRTGAVTCRADVRDLAGLGAAIAAVAGALGGLDALVNNAGVMLHSRVSAGRMADWDEMVGVNVSGVLHASYAALPYLRDAPLADVVNISSVAAERVAAPDFTVYSATKAALNRLTEGLRLDFGGFGIRVSLVSPGVVRTDWTRGIVDPGLRQAMGELRDRVGLAPRVVADQVAYLLALPPSMSIPELVITPFPPS